MKAEDTQGIFWQREAPEQTIAGILSYSRDEGIVLSLFGSLGPLPQSIPAERSFPVVHGLLWNSQIGPQVTLMDCRLSGLQMNAPGIMREAYRVSRVFGGAHLLAAEDFLFDRVRLGLSGLSSWAEVLTGLDARSRRSEPNTSDYTLRWLSPSPSRGKLRGATFTLDASAKYNFAPRTLSITEEVHLEIESDQPSPIDALSATYVHPIQNFLTLATDRPNAIADYKVTRRDKGNPITVIERYAFSDESATADLLPQDMLFTLRDVKDRLPRLLAKWVDLSKELSDFFGSYFSAYYSGPTLVDFQFLLAAQSVETYGRARLPKIAAEFNLGKVLRAVLEMHSGLVEPLFGSDVDATAEAFNDWWAFVVHRHRKFDSEQQYLEPLYWSTQRLLFLVKICLLCELQFSADDIRKYLNRNRRYLHLLGQKG
jgi:hypothetical protein